MENGPPREEELSFSKQIKTSIEVTCGQLDDPCILLSCRLECTEYFSKLIYIYIYIYIIIIIIINSQSGKVVGNPCAIGFRGPVFINFSLVHLRTDSGSSMCYFTGVAAFSMKYYLRGHFLVHVY